MKAIVRNIKNGTSVQDDEHVDVFCMRGHVGMEINVKESKYKDWYTCDDYYFHESWLIFKEDEMKKDFTLSDLESGMVVECKNGECYLVVGEYLCRNNGFNQLSDYNEDLINRYDSEPGFDIVRVFKPRPRDAIDAIVSNNKLGELIWQREPEIKEVTLEEIAEKFGVEVGSLRIKE